MIPLQFDIQVKGYSYNDMAHGLLDRSFFTQLEAAGEEGVVSELLVPPSSPRGAAPWCRRAGSTCPNPRWVSRRVRGSPLRGR